MGGMLVVDPTIFPHKATVVPRVYASPGGEVLPLEHCVRRLLERGGNRCVCLHGPSGSGKTTALRHLAAVLPSEIRPHLLDRPVTFTDLTAAGRLIIYSTDLPPGTHQAASLALAPWGDDDLIEYLLAAKRGCCASVMSRVRTFRDKAMLSGLPELWRVVLDELAADDSIQSVTVAVRSRLSAALSDPTLRLQAYCLRAVLGTLRREDIAEVDHSPMIGRDVLSLIRHRPVQLSLAADWVVEQLCDGAGAAELEQKMPEDFIREVGRLAGYWPGAVDQLRRLVRHERTCIHPMAASVLLAADPTWRPDGYVPDLTAAYLSGARWAGADLCSANLSTANFDDADLGGADLDYAKAGMIDLRRASLRGASMHEMHAPASGFGGADLTGARARGLQATESFFDGATLDRAALHRAKLAGCSFAGASFVGARMAGVDLRRAKITDAVFTNANLSKADLSGLCLRPAIFTGARFRGARLERCDLERMELPGADFRRAVLRRADLTGSVMPGADFRRADLTLAGLADVEWIGADLRHADLRGATFHAGSSRSGLVGSVTACEGSRTGFYTDEYDEQGFKSPDEIRKANLCGADLRGANIDGVDFYLVDLRGAKYTAEQREHFTRCRAIL